MAPRRIRRAFLPGGSGTRRLPRRIEGDAVARVLVVEDNADLAYGLQNNLEIEGYEVRV